MTKTKEYLAKIGLPEGFRLLKPNELESGLTVFLWGSDKEQPRAYGPHRYEGEASTRVGYPFYNFNRAAYFSHPLDELLVVKKTVTIDIDKDTTLVLEVDGDNFDVSKSTVFDRNANGKLASVADSIRPGLRNAKRLAILYMLCRRISMGEDVTHPYTIEQIRLDLNSIKTMRI